MTAEVVAMQAEAPALDRSGYAERINDAWRRSVEGVLEAGRWLKAAKEVLQHGEYEAMIERDLPFATSTARMLVKIAKDPRISNRQHVDVLPASWGTLYELTALDDDSFAAALEAGKIKPDMERQEARALRTEERRSERLARVEALASAPPPLPEPVADDDAAPAVAPSAPPRRYGVLYADPPWQHKTWSDAGKQKSPENHYPTMTQVDLLALPIGRLAGPRAALFMWTTGGHLANALELMRAWGFDYRSHQVWQKTYPSGEPRRGTGYWFINTHELLLLGIRGDMPAPVMGTQAESVIAAPVGRHSEKPAVFREEIERMFPGVGRLELFCRGRAPEGWDGWGNECEAGT